MEVKSNRKSGFPEVVFSREEKQRNIDIDDGRRIGEMMETKPWKRLMEYRSMIKEKFVSDLLANGLSSDELRERKGALKGFLEYMTMELRIVARAEAIIAQEEADKNESRDAEPDGE